MNVKMYPAQHIVMLRPDFRNGDLDDLHFIKIARAFQKGGHRVTIITCHIPPILKREIADIYVLETWNWIPKNTFEKFGYFVYLVESLIVAFKYMFCGLMPRPSVVLNNGTCFTLPLLRFGTQSTLIHLKSFDQKENEIQWFLDYSDEIILPDFEFMKKLHCMENKCSVLYPCISTTPPGNFDLKSIVPNYPRNGFLFCCFGDYYVQSNFELALAAFCISLKMVEASNLPKMHLVISGKYNPKNPLQKEYLSKIKKLVYIKMFGKNITLLQNITSAQKKCLILNSRAILCPTLETTYSATIFEAMSLAKTVIATNCSFAKEILIHQITGYLLPPNPTDFAEIMEKLIDNKILPVYIGNLAETEFRYKYTFLQFTESCNQIVSKHCVYFKKLKIK